MAIYWTMGVDCGSDATLAAKISRQFDGFVISPTGMPAVTCNAHVETHRNIHFVRVHPRGMGVGTLPENERRPELTDDRSESAVRSTLYVELKKLPGFRRAMFGAECFDQMAFATPEEDSEIDYGFMISSIKAFPESPAERKCEPFADGYRIVTAMQS